jgi:hypothetical protein
MHFLPGFFVYSVALATTDFREPFAAHGQEAEFVRQLPESIAASQLLLAIKDTQEH